MARKVGVAGIIPRGRSVLLLRRSQTDGFLPGAYDLPGGGLNPGEQPEEGVRREVLEETGLRASVVKNLGTRSYVLSDAGRNDKVLMTFLLKVNGKSEIKLSKEHDRYRWVSESELGDVFGEGDLMGRVVHDYFTSNHSPKK